jgi:hypothetical protein
LPNSRKPSIVRARRSLRGNAGHGDPQEQVRAAGLGAGQDDAQPAATLDTGTAGTFIETLTLNPTGSNASGYAASLAAETLTISATVLASMNWSGPSRTNRSGSWNAASNWTQGIVPASQSPAIVNAAGSYTLTSSQDNVVGAVSISTATATLAIAGGSFTIAGTAGSSNAGTIAIADGRALTLSGIMTDTGTIALSSSGDVTNLLVSASVTLKGTGALTMTDFGQNMVASNGAAAAFTNAATIAGSGQIGDSNLSLVNQAGGIIDATGARAALVINTGANSVRNSVLMEATGTAGLTVAGALVNNGALAVSVGTLSVGGGLSGTGSAVISGGAILDLDLLNQFGIQYSTNPALYTLASDGLGTHPGTLLLLASPGP